jgi:hypothetical protein
MQPLSFTKSTRCATTTCVEVEGTAEGIVVTSSVPGNDGRVVFTQDEWNTFIGNVKAGAWDDTTSNARTGSLV